MNTIFDKVESKSARLDLKTNTNLKNQLEEAAAISGVTLTAFILSAAADKAVRIVEHYNFTILTSNAWNRLNEVIASPPEPTAAMKELMAQRNFNHGRREM